jgi:hypothetical protein
VGLITQCIEWKIKSRRRCEDEKEKGDERRVKHKKE